MDYEDDIPKRKETESQKKRRVDDAFRSILAREDGRIVLATVLGWTCFEVDNLAVGEHCARNEGMRSVGLKIVRKLRDLDQEAYLKLYREIMNG